MQAAASPDPPPTSQFFALFSRATEERLPPRTQTWALARDLQLALSAIQDTWPRVRMLQRMPHDTAAALSFLTDDSGGAGLGEGAGRADSTHSGRMGSVGSLLSAPLHAALREAETTLAPVAGTSITTTAERIRSLLLSPPTPRTRTTTRPYWSFRRRHSRWLSRSKGRQPRPVLWSSLRFRARGRRL